MWFVLCMSEITTAVSLLIAFLETSWGCSSFVTQNGRDQEAVVILLSNCLSLPDFLNFPRNRASGTPSGATRKGANALPKLASSTTRPRSHSSSLLSGFGRGTGAAGLSPVGSSSGVGGMVSMKRQRRTSTGLQISSTGT